MQSEQLVAIIKQPHKIDTAAVQELRKLLHQYPYFQLACTLIAKALYDQGPDKAQQAIQLAAVYATDRHRLKLLLEDKLADAKLAEESPVGKVANLVQPSYKKVQTDSETLQVDFINTYFRNIYAKQEKKVTKKRSLEQLNIIDNFIQKSSQVRLVASKELSLKEVDIDLTKESTTLHDSLLTESLAQVMLKQGKIECAMEIYKRLQLKFPEKGLYFSALSEELKKDI